MKKLMIAASAALCVTVGFSDVTSANIVGYGPTALASGGAGICAGPQFVAIGTDPIDLINIKVTGYVPYDESIPGSGSDGDVQVQTLTAGGGMDKEYTWFDDSEGAAWFRTDDLSYKELKEGEITLTPGEGLWSLSGVAGRFLQTSGQVPTQADIQTGLKSGGAGLPTANPTPGNVDLINCYVWGEGYVPYREDIPGSGSDGDVQVQTLTAGGGMDKEYTWFDDSEGAAWFRTDDLSYDELKEGEMTRLPGEGFWVLSGVAKRTFVWPKVVLTK